MKSQVVDIETFRLKDQELYRTIKLRNGLKKETKLLIGFERKINRYDLDLLFDQVWLQKKKPPKMSSSGATITSIDLFAGCGGLALGLKEGAIATGYKFKVKAAIDIDKEALKVFGMNFPESDLICNPVEKYFDGKLGSRITTNEKKFKEKYGKVDVVLGGPPCQGHSDLNNHTRNKDSRNELYLLMARFCEVMRPKHVLIENVPGVLRDKSQVAQRTWQHLISLGYHVQSVTIDLSKYGVAQKRKRNITVASLSICDDIETFLEIMERDSRPLSWAIRDLVDQYSEVSIWDSAPKPSTENQRRIKYLFDKKIYDLPNSKRPDCHKLKHHTYVSVYGRLHWEKPSPTITTGFGSMGRGRYVHPSKQRTITPHEAARIQFFPDYFFFGSLGRTMYQKLIGNAVPPKLGYLIGVFLFR